MWRRIEVNTRIDHPAEAIFAYLVDPLRWREFAPACVYREAISPDPRAIGARWRSTDRIGPFRFHFIDELAELEPDRRVVWLSSAPWNARVEYLCTPDGGGTRICATYEGDVTGFLRVLVAWLPTWAFRGILAQDFRRLRRILNRREDEARRWRERHLHVAHDQAMSRPAAELGPRRAVEG